MLNITMEPDEEEREMDFELNKKIENLLKWSGETREKEKEDFDVKQGEDLEYKIFRLEKLLERRPLLLNNCLLRQNPHNVDEWVKRIKLVQDDKHLVIKTFGEALTQVDPVKSTGNFDRIWIMFADYYTKHGDLRNANLIYHKATKINFKTVEELTNVWSAWIEMLVENDCPEDAIVVAKQALFRRPSAAAKHNTNDHDKSVHDALGVSTKLWTLYIDLETNWGTVETTKTAYKRMMDLKILTPFILLNYCSFLEDHKYYEESFKAYEAGLSLFTWPALYDIWILYLSKFVERYKSEKIERARDLFEKAITSCPQDRSFVFFVMFADTEEKYGLINHAIEVYDKMVDVVPYDRKLEAFNLYISKVASFLGITKTRSIFEVLNIISKRLIYLKLTQ
eukprot:TRINITY_DN1551_c0_g1_i6.p1 TRINITY_DN1551_c0_g1~~TRINITY_DN1551_c0_g1_i6.p1  ORF type:complete len:395 (-),score=96.02 TRINITY_DN1551_c0_g1_i6:467-1651(-)